MSAGSFNNGFMVIHGNQPEWLRQLLIHWFKAHPLHPLEDEIILVQSNGIAQWLKLALAQNTADDPSSSGGCGIAAALEILLPARFIWRVYRAVLGADAVPDTSSFDKSFLIWRLMRLLPKVTLQPGYEPLARFLEADNDLRKRYQLATKIADLFDQYQVYRADWLTAWANGDDILYNAHHIARPLATQHSWQAMLWRALLADAGTTDQSSRATVHANFLAACQQLEHRPAELPRRITVFGLSSLPRQSLEVLLAISRITQVILCVHNPCEYYWTDLLTEQDHARRTSRRHARKKNAPATITEEMLHLHAHPLLAAWGKQGRDYIALLDELDQPDTYRPLFEQANERIDLFHSHGDSTLLNQLQDDIRLLRTVAETRATWPPVDPAQDYSIRFHCAHSMQREVEIVHDQILAALNTDATLRPRDIIVMVPDVNSYAPHIEAIFAQIDPSDARYIPFSIADLTQRQQIPLISALEFLLHITEARLTANELLDLLNVPAVRQRFGLTETDLPQLHQWIRQTNIRWGLHNKHRAQFIPSQTQSQQRNEQNTWLHGLKRMLLGYATGYDPTGRADYSWHDIEPYGEISGLEATLVGALSHLLLQLEILLQTFTAPASPTIWGQRLQSLLQNFFQTEHPSDTALLLQLQTSLQTWLETCTSTHFTEAIPLAIVREHWLNQIDQPNLTQRFMLGTLTFATLMPMRAIPFRMVCLLGMNDSEFPRVHPPVDFDLMAQDIRPGDRSRREDDRYLFLEALLSAREKLHISWIGKNILDNSDLPPSVLVSQLRDHIAAGWQLATSTTSTSTSNEDLLAALTVEHKLQAFNQDYFGSESSTASPFFTYAREWERNAACTPAAHLPSSPLPPAILEHPLSLGQLAAFLKNPVQTFCRERLGIYYEIDILEHEDHEPFVLDGLNQWLLQDELIQVRLDAIQHGHDETAAMTQQFARIQRRGELPLGEMTTLLTRSLSAPLDEMFTRYREINAAWPHPLEDQTFEYVYHTTEGATYTIQDSITQYYGNDHSQQLCRIELNSSDILTNKKPRYDKLLSVWLLHLAAHLNGQSLTTYIIGKDGQTVIPPLAFETAQQYFDAIIAAYLGNLRAPLPLAPKTGFAWLKKQGTPVTGSPFDTDQHDAVHAARKHYEGDDYQQGEVTQNAYLQRFYPTFTQLWSNGTFSQLCETLYAPLMRHLSQSQASKAN